jgi:coenzyme F420-reducing hydrogenase gamma subunit
MGKNNKKPTIGIFSFTCDEGCQFVILFIEGIFDILKKFDVQYFHLLKEKNRETEFDIAFIEGAISSKKEIEKLKIIRKKSKIVVALGACACHGGIPAMRNFIENEQLGKYVLNQRMLDDSVPAAGIDNYIKVDHYLYGCPCIQKEFVDFLTGYLKDKLPEENKKPVCSECPRQGKPECFMRQKVECLGPVARAGCGAICPKGNVPCMLCRGPLPAANIAGEVKLFKSFGLDEKAIKDRIRMFKNIEVE